MNDDELSYNMAVGEVSLKTPCRCNTCGWQGYHVFTQVCFGMDNVIYFNLPTDAICAVCKSTDIIFTQYQRNDPNSGDQLY